MSELDKIMEEYQITHVVVGLPKNMNGSIGPRGQVCQQIAEEIQDRYQVPVTLWDERLSTSAVEKTLISADISRRKRKKVVDQVAATWILQGYLDSKRR
jgi:putative Holliday junction resolvase